MINIVFIVSRNSFIPYDDLILINEQLKRINVFMKLLSSYKTSLAPVQSNYIYSRLSIFAYLYAFHINRYPMPIHNINFIINQFIEHET